MGTKKKSYVGLFVPYAFLSAVALAASWVTHSFEPLQKIFTTVPEGLYLVIALLFAIGYGLNSFAPKTAIPSFVWAIFFGMALQPMFRLLTQEIETLRIIVEILAALVLFVGGVEVPFRSFKKNFGPIASMALFGTLLTVLLFALSLETIGNWMQIPIPAGAFLLMGAILASTDPTAIIPSLETLKFRRAFVRDLAVSESAVNDVVGTILTRFFLVTVLAAAGAGGRVIDLFIPFFSRQSFDNLALEFVWGLVVGIVTAWVLKRWSDTVSKGTRSAVDPALFFAAPIFAFAAGGIIGGSGFLAAFVAGLLFDANAGTHAVRVFFETFVDRFIKPIIFLLLGAVVPLPTLMETAGIGIIAAIIFMFIVRPVVVFLSLLPWVVRHRATFAWRELVFMSFVRETGAIPAVLILVAVGSGVAGSEYIFAIGMWVILLTLILEPPLTPKVAERLGIAEVKK